MATTPLTGTAVDPTTSPAASGPTAGDPAASSVVRAAIQSCLNYVAWLRVNCALRNMLGSVITNHGTPSASGDVTNKGYVDGVTGRAQTWTAQQTFTQALVSPGISSPATMLLNKPPGSQIGIQHNGTTVFMVDGNGIPYFLGNAVTGIGTPTAIDHAANKGYVDSRFVVAGRIPGGFSGPITRQTGSVTASVTRTGTGLYTVSVPGLTADGIVSVSAVGSGGVQAGVYAVSAGQFTAWVGTLGSISSNPTATDSGDLVFTVSKL